MKNLQELFVDQLRDVHNAEKQLVKALPRMAKAATTAALRKAFEDHLAVTREQVARLDAVFEEVGARPGRKKCAAMEGLVQEGEELMAEAPGPAVLDAGLIAAAQRVEHYEIAAYGTMATLAKSAGMKELGDLLGQTLAEEKKMDEELSQIAEAEVNMAFIEMARAGANENQKGGSRKAG